GSCRRGAASWLPRARPARVEAYWSDADVTRRSGADRKRGHMRRWLEEWSILTVGMIIIVGMLALTGFQQGGGGTQASQESHGSQNAQPSGAPQSTRPAAPPPSNAAAAPARQAQAASQPAPVAAPAQPAQAPSQAAPAAVPAQLTPAADRPAATTGQAAPSTQAATGAAQGDATAGRLVFRKCQACHSMDPGKNLIGPSLGGGVNRKAGTAANFDYSPAMKQSNVTWDAATLDAYLADPQKVVPGNRMPFAGLKTAHDRKDVVAFLAGSSTQAQAAAPSPGTSAPQ